MFNICPGCGQYSVDKNVAEDRAVCRACGHGHSFLRLPLLVVTGASCTGKSTVALNLPQRLPGLVCLESDILWCDQFASASDDYRSYREIWLRLVKNVSQGGRPVLLVGSSIPEQFEQCRERRYIGDIHYLAYVCQEDELVRRLKARPGWRESGSEETIKRMVSFNAWLRANAERQSISLLDTTDQSVAETVDATVSWALERQGDQ